jgi:hypothetical protein
MSPETEGHVGRLLLLVDAFSDQPGSALDGLTKLAKLDFLVRYPVFLEALAGEGQGTLSSSGVPPTDAERVAVDSPMVRYKYGPWDDRYYTLIGALVGRGLVEYVEGRGRASLRTTSLGRSVAADLREAGVWARVVERVGFVRAEFDLPGSQLKSLIYDAFPTMVEQDLRTTIAATPGEAQ